MKVLCSATILMGLIMFPCYSWRLMAQKPMLDFSWKYQVMQRGCMLTVVCVMEFRKWCAAFLLWGDVSVLAELHFVLKMNIKYSYSAHGVNHKATQSDWRGFQLLCQQVVFLNFVLERVCLSFLEFITSATSNQHFIRKLIVLSIKLFYKA